METILQPFLSGFAFLECPRWRDGRLWFCDVRAQTIFSVSTDGDVKAEYLVSDWPSGFGFLPDGSILVVLMNSRKIVALDGCEELLYADLTRYDADFINELTIDDEGRSYTGTRSAALGPDSASRRAETNALLLVHTDGTSDIVAENVQSPNGVVINDAGDRLFLAETYARQITQFNRSPQGELTNRQVLAKFDTATPDGMCMDQSGGLWVGSPYTQEVLYIAADGRVARRFATAPGGGVACMLGGGDRRRLFVLGGDPAAFTAQVENQSPGAPMTGGSICTYDVEIPGAGHP